MGLLVLLGGIAVVGLTWRWAAGDGHYDVKAGIIGPLMVVLGTGLILHGAQIPLDGIRPLTRIYGVAGSLAGLLNLFLLGFFERPHRSEAARLLDLAVPILMVVVWFLPDRFYGGTGHVPDRSPSASIDPR